ncbi:MAG: T9SS type A sorting domain-containing protein, partial [Acidimicrobiia bacterium]|nr:T9SS type A sorting domain-containing protein [Acidimicrobiia bacterium]
GVTLNWDAANGDPVGQGWVQGTTFFDETTLVWGAELAIVDPAISKRSSHGTEIGFNVGLGLAKAEGAGDRGEATYAFSSWVVCNPDLLDDELWCGPGGTVMSDAHSFATLTLVSSGGVAVEPVPGSEVPSEFVLEQNYPNPFNPSTTIEYAVPQAGAVAVSIYNAIGLRVASVVDQHQQAGRYRAEWNADKVPSGLYIYQLEVDGKVVSARKMTLVK